MFNEKEILIISLNIGKHAIQHTARITNRYVMPFDSYVETSRSKIILVFQTKELTLHQLICI